MNDYQRGTPSDQVYRVTPHSLSKWLNKLLSCSNEDWVTRWMITKGVHHLIRYTGSHHTLYQNWLSKLLSCSNEDWVTRWMITKGVRTPADQVYRVTPHSTIHGIYILLCTTVGLPQLCTYVTTCRSGLSARESWLGFKSSPADLLLKKPPGSVQGNSILTRPTIVGSKKQ